MSGQCEVRACSTEAGALGKMRLDTREKNAEHHAEQRAGHVLP